MNVTRRLAELSARHDLPESAVPAIARLLELIAEDPRAPTTLRDPRFAIDAHVADALSALDVLSLRTAGSLADLGSGAGVPGLVLAAALPSAGVALVEANKRKCAFLDHAVAEMGLVNVTVVAQRAEGWPEGIGRHDAVTARALAPLPVLVEYAAPLLALGGTLVAWKGRRDATEEDDGVAAAGATGLVLSEVRRVQPWDGAEQLHLHVYSKVNLTPNKYPRRPGMASKRPLRAST
ncbi:MAG TPA: 16S rRNA (guanine(527)-N(7))-methyltransferase RsmG [Solirubrobacteraceae bacterium]|jgi:16S rRNA (guanine527-N7)-methyltransferase|nr:16S rRNA (guanine(527)-N(7))-methyltransferase RsmG [Solirubrobacteraceae bacterium]